MTEHLPALQVVVPLLAAPLCVFARRRWLARALALGATWFSFASALTLLGLVRDGGTLSYALGGWEPPWGIEYRVDSVNALILVVVTAIASVTLPLGVSAAAKTGRAQRQYLFCAAFLLCLAGLEGIAITGDAFNVFVFLEISSLASYTLVSLGSSRRALVAAFSYLIMGTIGGTFILIGVGLLYQMTGTLNIQDLGERVPELGSTRTIRASFAFLTVGASIKLAVFPLHQWLPNAYAHAPAAVSAFLAGTATKVIYYLLIRLIFTLFGASFVFGSMSLGTLLTPLSLVAMFVGSIAAIYQQSVKRLLAYSSIAQIGYLTLALSLGTEAGIHAGLLHVFNHALIKAGLFLAVGCLAWSAGSDEIADLRGIGRRMPLSTAAFVVGGLGIIGVPATAGFVSKWYLVSAALDTGQPAVAVLILASSLLAIAYVWRVIEVAYFKAPADDGSSRREAPASMLVPTWVTVGATVFFGLFAELPVSAAGAAARDLFEPPSEVIAAGAELSAAARSSGAAR